jgi:hypothetical protein
MQEKKVPCQRMHGKLVGSTSQLIRHTGARPVMAGLVTFALNGIAVGEARESEVNGEDNRRHRLLANISDMNVCPQPVIQPPEGSWVRLRVREGI